MNRMTKTLVGVTTLAVSAGLIVAGGGAASAATTPPYEPDPQAVGSISFYNSAGVQITGGNVSSSPFAAYAVGSGTPRAGDIQANLEFCTPSITQQTAGYNCDAPFGSFKNYPLNGASVPANIKTMSQTHPVYTGGTGDEAVADIQANFPNNDTSTTDGYKGLYQIRLITANSLGNQSTAYDSADVLVNGSTYTLVYPTIAATPSITAPAPSTPSPAASGTHVTFTSTVTESDSTTPAAGTVELFDGATDVGPATFTASTGAVSETVAPATGSHSYTFTYTPTGGTAVTSSATAYSVSAALTPTQTALAVTGGLYTGSDVTFAATVTPVGAVPGTVVFKDNGTVIPGTVVTSGSGGNVFTLDVPAGLSSGAHSVVATFTAYSSLYASSSSSAQAFVTSVPLTGACLQAGSSCSDTQYIQTSIPVGTLTITTPYIDAAHALIVGPLVLQANATEFKGSAAFGNITVTDLRAGNLPWTITALSTNLVNTTDSTKSISGENVGLTGLVGTASAGFAGTVVRTDNAAADLAVVSSDSGSKGLGNIAHTVAVADHGVGTFTLSQGTLTITAPTSTSAGTYTGTILFTVG